MAAPASGLPQLRDLVFNDEDLQARLRAVTEWESFATQAVAAGAEMGARVTREELEANRVDERRRVIERELPGKGPLPPSDDVIPVGWTPIHLLTSGGRARVEWCDLRGLPDEGPFWMDTVRRALSEPYRLLFRPRTGIGALETVAARADPLDPAGLVLHSSRCGSTLLCQMLGATPGTVTLSEPAPLDEVLRAPGIDEHTRERWLRWMLAALVQQSQPDRRRVVVKLDAWSTCELPLIRRALPGVPWIFLYRRPEEVIASHMREPGQQMVAGGPVSGLFGLELKAAVTAGREDYYARVVGAILASGLEHLDGAALLVDYATLAGTAARDVAAHFGLARDEGALARMLAVAANDAKRPYQRFDAVVSRRERPVTASVRTAARRWATEPYERLEALRTAQPQAVGQC